MWRLGQKNAAAMLKYAFICDKSVLKIIIRKLLETSFEKVTFQKLN